MALVTNLTSYYSLGGTGDSVTASAHTLTNAGTVTFTAGKILNAATFTNPNSTQNLNTAFLANPTLPISISAWFNPAVVNDDGNIWSLADNTTEYYQLKLKAANSKITFRSNTNATSTDVDTGITAVVSTWHHVVVVFNSSTSVDIYVNNVKTNTAATVDNPPTTALDRFTIGALGRTTPAQYYNGLVDEVGIWTRALTSDDVNLLYFVGTGQTYPLNNQIASHTVGAFTLTGVNINLLRVLSSVMTVVAFTLTGNALRTFFKEAWANVTKIVASWTNTNKNE